MSQLRFNLKIWNNIWIRGGRGTPGYALAATFISQNSVAATIETYNS